MRRLPPGDPLLHIRGWDAPEPVRLYWPATSTRKGPVPLIVFSHGLGGSRKGYGYLGEGWSARGTASVPIQHAGSDETLWQGNPIMLLNRLDGAADEREAIERTWDVSFGLDRLLQRDSPVHAAIDRKRIVAAGHSFGANKTLILTGAQVIREPLGEAGHRRGRAGLPRPRSKVRSRPPRRLERDVEADPGRGADAVPGRRAAMGQEAARLRLGGVIMGRHRTSD